jgi:hypothetical protein
MESIYTIPPLYFITISQQQKTYGFDVRSLYQWWNNLHKNFEKKEYMNPLTMIAFNQDQLALFHKKCTYILQTLHKTLYFPEQLEEQQKEMTTETLIFNTFYEIQQLDFYNDGVSWIKEIKTIARLKDFFFLLEDMWNYRAQLPSDKKYDIVSNGSVFTSPKEFIHKQTDFSKLLHLIFKDCYRLVHEGKTRDDRKLGAMYILTCLTVVSPSAAKHMPHFYNPP